MSRRILLGGLTLVFCLGGILAVIGVLASSLSPSAQTLNEAEVVLPIAPIVSGKVQVFNVRGSPLFLLRPDDQQRQSIAILDAHVVDRNSKAYVAELDAFVYWGVSTNRGCNLEHKIPQDSLLLQWAPDAVWLGGYWNPWCEVSYDYAGRAIDSYEFTFNGYHGRFPNLERPKLKFFGNSVIVQLL